MERNKVYSDSIIKYGNDARKEVINAIIAISDLLKSALGPLGMRKMIIEKYGTVIISNDGLTIIKDLGVSHPAADSLIQFGKSFVDNVGDGVKSCIILIGELLKRALTLIQKNFHPNQIISGYNMALKTSINRLIKISIPVVIMVLPIIVMSTLYTPASCNTGS